VKIALEKGKMILVLLQLLPKLQRGGYLSGDDGKSDKIRHSPESLHAEFGEHFEVVDGTHATHQTPFGME
jgi:hypothetical protein